MIGVTRTWWPDAPNESQDVFEVQSLRNIAYLRLVQMKLGYTRICPSLVYTPFKRGL